MSKGTILYIGAFELPDKNAAAHRVLSNGKIYKSLGYDVVFVGIDKSLSFDTEILTTFKKIQTFEAWSLPYPKSKLEWIKYLSDIRFIDIMKVKYPNLKLVVAYNYPAIALNNIRNYCKKNNIKIMADVTEWYSLKGSSLIFKVIKGFDSYLRMRIIQKKLDGLIVISRYLENYYSKCKNVLRLPPLVDITENKWEVLAENNRKKNPGKNKWEIIYTGSPGKIKDKTNTIIDALYNIKELDNFDFQILGINEEEFIEENPQIAYKISALDDKIHFLGKLSHKESLMKLNNADFSVFIRDRSRLTMAGFPTKFVESVTCSTPVITSETSDINEYFTDESIGILLKDSSSEQLSNCLQKIFETNLSKKRLKTELIVDTFHFEKFRKLVEEQLNKMF